MFLYMYKIKVYNVHMYHFISFRHTYKQYNGNRYDVFYIYYKYYIYTHWSTYTFYTRIHIYIYTQEYIDRSILIQKKIHYKYIKFTIKYYIHIV